MPGRTTVGDFPGRHYPRLYREGMQDDIGAAVGRGELVLADDGGETRVMFDLRALGALLTS